MSRPRWARSPCAGCHKPVKRARDRFCNNKCQKDFEYRTFIERWKAGLESGNIRQHQDGVSRHIRRHLFEKHNSKCQECGWGEVHPDTGLVPLTINHRDGKWANTSEENLQLLCPSCHSLTPNYGRLNGGQGRKHRHRTRTL